MRLTCQTPLPLVHGLIDQQDGDGAHISIGESQQQHEEHREEVAGEEHSPDGADQQREQQQTGQHGPVDGPAAQTEPVARQQAAQTVGHREHRQQQ